jgi:ankyrin repeat protein
LLGVLVLGVVCPSSGHRVGLHAQRMMSEDGLKRLAATLIAYTENHGESFPATIGDLSDQFFDENGFGINLYAVGDVRSFTTSDLKPSSLVTEVFAHHYYLATKDRCHLVVFERPGLWDDHTIAYLDLDLRGRWNWRWDPGSAFDRMKATRVTEERFAEYLSKLGWPVSGQSPADSLVEAAESGDLDKISKLLSEGASIDDQDRRGWTALTIAAQTGRAEVVELLISKGAHVNLRDDVGKGRTALMRASTLGYASVVEALQAHGADVLGKLDDGSAALMGALAYPLIAQKLVAAGADVNEQSKPEWSPLIAACSYGYAQTVRVLIERGADMKRDGLIALDWAARNGRADVIETLLSKGLAADKKVLGECLVSASCHPDAMKKLILAGADLNSTCKGCNGRTALMVSAFSGCPEAVEFLIAAGADVNSKDDKGHTALDLVLASTRSDWVRSTSAEKKRFSEVIDMLRRSGASESGLKVEWPERW